MDTDRKKGEPRMNAKEYKLRTLARKMARDLFLAYGDKQPVYRLVLTTADGRTKGGWCMVAVAERLYDRHLRGRVLPVGRRVK